ncbi:metal ABC transporter substrate-binding protein [SAR86 cluster bacterium]|nr:metal ABC transporter substrate-binding protein [SAR86 cluster bacterium]
MKSLFYIFLVTFSLGSFSIDKFRVITTFTVIADIAQNVAGDKAIVESITKPDAEIHNYQATPGDIKKAQKADLIIYNGLNLELWFDKFFKNLKGVPKITISDGIDPVGISQGPYLGKPNPHAWMSHKNVFIYIDNIERALIENDPMNAEIYKNNSQEYKLKIQQAIKPYESILKNIPDENKWLVTSEGAFSYLTRDYNLKELYLWPMNSDGQGTPQQIRRVIDTINKNNIKAIFSESTVSPKPAQQVARETNATYAGVLYVDSLSSKNGPVPTYIDLLSKTLSTIAEGLK